MSTPSSSPSLAHLPPSRYVFSVHTSVLVPNQPPPPLPSPRPYAVAAWAIPSVSTKDDPSPRYNLPSPLFVRTEHASHTRARKAQPDVQPVQPPDRGSAALVFWR